MFPHILHKSRERKNSKRISNLDKVAYVIGITASLFNIPQIFKIWIAKSAEGVSLVAWIGFSASSIFWLVYSYTHKEKALATAFILTLTFQLIIIFGILIYQ